jgi:hypothetical protein
LAEAEDSFGISAKQLLPILARAHPNRRILETKELALTFDTGRLSDMKFLKDFDFKIPLTPYAEHWKNLNGLGFGRDTRRGTAAGYLSTWEKRVSTLGARKIESGNDLSACEFSTYSLDEDDDLNALGVDWSVLGIHMGKSRRAGGGGLWADGWIIDFATARDADLYQVPIGKVRSISAFCDEFNTAARK